MIMKTRRQHFGLSQKLLFLAVLAAFGPVHADDDEVAQLIKPDSTVVSAGLGVASGNSADRAIFGQYNGWRKNEIGILLDFELIRRDDAGGLWTNFSGSNLGLDNRELTFSQQKQGDWGYSAGYSELVRHEPRSVITGVLGSGTTNPVVNPAAGLSESNLELKRKGLTVGLEKWLTPNLMVEASFKTEKKDGARLSGIGVTCSNVIGGYPCSTTTGALLLLPEPINSTTQQFEAKINLSGDNYLLSGGYYGSFFSNSNSSMKPVINAPTWNAGLIGYLQQTVALPPDNQAHQFYLSGNYAFNSWIRANFHVAHTKATQDQDFASMGLVAAAGLPPNFGAEVNSTVAQLGLSVRPMPKLSLTGNWRYEDVKDDTPLALYNGAFTNTPNSSEKATGKADLSYVLPVGFRATLGVDYAYMKRQRPVATTSITSLTSLREWTEELGYRVELRRSMSDTINTSVSWTTAIREGEHWMSLIPGANLYKEVRYVDINDPIGVFPFTMMDRKRDKIRVLADWMATDDLSLQFIVDSGKDSYAAPTTKGLHDSGMQSYGIDAALTLSEAWKLTAYINHGKQTLHVDHNVGYIAALDNVTLSVGLGVIGKLAKNIEVGGDLMYIDDSSRYQLGSGNAELPGVLPDVVYRATTLKLFGKYALDKSADVRVDLVHQRVKFDEWTWGNNGTPFLYSDNTMVAMQPKQSVTYLGARYAYRFK